MPCVRPGQLCSTVVVVLLPRFERIFKYDQPECAATLQNFWGADELTEHTVQILCRPCWPFHRSCTAHLLMVVAIVNAFVCVLCGVCACGKQGKNSTCTTVLAPCAGRRAQLPPLPLSVCRIFFASSLVCMSAGLSSHASLSSATVAMHFSCRCALMVPFATAGQPCRMQWTDLPTASGLLRWLAAH